MYIYTYYIFQVLNRFLSLLGVVIFRTFVFCVCICCVFCLLILVCFFVLFLCMCFLLLSGFS